MLKVKDFERTDEWKEGTKPCILSSKSNLFVRIIAHTHTHTQCDTNFNLYTMWIYSFNTRYNWFNRPTGMKFSVVIMWYFHFVWIVCFVRSQCVCLSNARRFIFSFSFWTCFYSVSLWLIRKIIIFILYNIPKYPSINYIYIYQSHDLLLDCEQTKTFIAFLFASVRIARFNAARPKQLCGISLSI